MKTDEQGWKKTDRFMKMVGVVRDWFNHFEGLDVTDQVVGRMAIRVIEIEDQTRQQTLEEVDENTSDGYHTFKELYEFRKLYNAALFNEWYSQDKYNVHKSWKHHDGEECFGGGWFIVVATLPTGQISNHYEEKDWDLFRVVAKDRADEWDGHTSQDVAKRLLNQLKEK